MALKTATATINVPSDMNTESAQVIFNRALKDREYRRNYSAKRGETIRDLKEQIARLTKAAK